MAGQEIFGALVRAIGFGVALYGTYTIIWGALFLLWPHYWDRADGEKKDAVSAAHFLFGGLIQLFIGIAVIAEADAIVSMAY